jgi:hypothetical protein
MSSVDVGSNMLLFLLSMALWIGHFYIRYLECNHALESRFPPAITSFQSRGALSNMLGLTFINSSLRSLFSSLEIELVWVT